MLTLDAIIRDNATCHSKKIAFCGHAPGETITWSQFRDLVEDRGNFLRKNAAPGCVVVIPARASLDFYISITACLTRGYRAFPISLNQSLSLYKGTSLRNLELFLCHDREPTGAELHTNGSRAKNGSLIIVAPSVDGSPRVLEYSHQSIMAAAQIEVQANNRMFHGRARILNLRPAHNVAGLYFFVPAMLTSACTIIASGNAALPVVNAWLDLMYGLNPSSIYISSSYLRSVISSDHDGTLMGRMQQSTSTRFATIGPELLADEAKLIRDSFGMRILRRYGMSEFLHALSQYEMKSLLQHSEYVGKVPNGVRASIQNGYFQFQSKGMANWLLCNGRRTPLARNSKFLTRDKGRIEALGNLFLMGRGREMITVDGSHFHPREVEEYICRISGVSGAAVFGIKDHLRIQKTIAIVSTNQTITTIEPLKARILAALKNDLASFKHPFILRFVKKIPRTSDGQPDYEKLERMCDWKTG